MTDSGDWLDDIDFPATKQDLIDAADAAGCEQELIERLQTLGSEHYDSRTELEDELGADG